MKNILKKQKGITLIALVITIIVLLILAAVVLNLSNTVVINRAKDSANQTKDQAEKEGTGVNDVSTLMDNILDDETKN